MKKILIIGFILVLLSSLAYFIFRPKKINNNKDLDFNKSLSKEVTLIGKPRNVKPLTEIEQIKLASLVK